MGPSGLWLDYCIGAADSSSVLGLGDAANSPMPVHWLATALKVVRALAEGVLTTAR